MAAEDPADTLAAIKARVKAEYRRIWDKDYDDAEAKRNTVPKRKARKGRKKRLGKVAKGPKKRDVKRKTLRILDPVDP